MKSKHIFIVIAVVAAIIILFFSFDGSNSTEDYNQTIHEERAEKDRFMKTSGESPFASHREDFNGLKYFPPDEKYRIIATLVPAEGKKVRVLTTSDNKEQRYLEYAFAEFTLDNQKNKLLLLESIEEGPNEGMLFLAFGDETSGDETYGAGRYLDIEKAPGNRSIELDFNKAYNPYCAYSDNYSCPFPPRENLLNTPIRAGEKNYK